MFVSIFGVTHDVYFETKNCIEEEKNPIFRLNFIMHLDLYGFVHRLEQRCRAIFSCKQQQNCFYRFFTCEAIYKNNVRLAIAHIPFLIIIFCLFTQKHCSFC